MSTLSATNNTPLVFEPPAQVAGYQETESVRLLRAVSKSGLRGVGLFVTVHIDRTKWCTGLVRIATVLSLDLVEWSIIQSNKFCFTWSKLMHEQC